MKGLNYFIYLLALPLFFNSCKKGCTDPNAENYNPEAKKDNGSCYFINLPTNLESTITNVDNSGVVEIQATATNENFFTFIFMNATDSTIITSTNGSASYSYSSSGTYFIKTRANLTSSQYIERIDSVTVSFSVNNTGYTTPLNYPNYALSWNDEFNGTSLSNDWTHELGNGYNGWGNNELQYYREQNTSLENGYLKITAKQEYYGGKNYTSSRIKTQGNIFHTYGRIDIRAKLPFGQGIWPAMWMLGENFSAVGWPSCGEIDIMEMIGGNGYNDRTVHGTAHWESNGHAEYEGRTLFFAVDLQMNSMFFQLFGLQVL